MKKSNIKVNDKITFQEEKLPYEVKAVNGRFAICTRKFDKKEDNGILEHKVEMQAYMSKKEAFEDLKDEVIYTILDLKENIRSTDGYVFGIYDYNKQEDIDSCLNDLISGECQLSKRNQIPLTHFRIDRTQQNLITKNFNGKAIYNPSGKAGEYSYWACNFYVGCSNGCEYCYCKKGILAPVMGMDKPQLKKCFKDEPHALKVFESELSTNIVELQKHGLFFSFTTDPMLPETSDLTFAASGIAVHNYDVPVKILTKCTGWVDGFLSFMNNSNSDNEDREWRKNIAFGFTLTGHGELEPNASTNQERIEAMKKLHDAGFKTFASIEPIIEFSDSYRMIDLSLGECDLYKIGLQSGAKYNKQELLTFIERVLILTGSKFYFKDSLLKAAGIPRESLPSNCVSRDFNLFNQ